MSAYFSVVFAEYFCSGHVAHSAHIPMLLCCCAAPQSSLSSQSPSEDRQEPGPSGEQSRREPGAQGASSEHNQDQELPEEETPSISSMYLPGKHTHLFLWPALGQGRSMQAWTGDTSEGTTMAACACKTMHACIKIFSDTHIHFFHYFPLHHCLSDRGVCMMQDQTHTQKQTETN